MSITYVKAKCWQTRLLRATRYIARSLMSLFSEVRWFKTAKVFALPIDVEILANPSDSQAVRPELNRTLALSAFEQTSGISKVLHQLAAFR